MQNHTGRVSNWTVAVLVASVAAATGYLAHSIPATSGQSGTSTNTKSPVVVPANPVVKAPVVTTGGSGGRGGGDN